MATFTYRDNETRQPWETSVIPFAISNATQKAQPTRPHSQPEVTQPPQGQRKALRRARGLELDFRRLPHSIRLVPHKLPKKSLTSNA